MRETVLRKEESRIAYEDALHRGGEETCLLYLWIQVYFHVLVPRSTSTCFFGGIGISGRDMVQYTVHQVSGF